MPANLTPQYLEAEQRFKHASTAHEKIAALEEMMAIIPKHKGTEKMQADLKRRLAKLKAESQKKHGSSKISSLYSVQREGAGQVVLTGAPNVGKSSLLASLTHSHPEIADYPYTTRFPQPAMVPFENIWIQLVDMPPVGEEYYEPWMGGIIRQADLVLLVVDLSSDDLLEEVEGVVEILAGHGIPLGDRPAEGSEAEPIPSPHRTLLVANKSDALEAAANLEILDEFFGSRFNILPVSAVTGEGLERLKILLFEWLEVVRVYTKAPGKKVDLGSAPYVLKRGSTVLDVARAVHRDFVHTLKFARLWSSDQSKGSLRFEGQMVERSHPLEDGDILELHV